MNVQSREVFGLRQPHQYFLQQRQWVMILDSSCPTVIDTQPQAAVGLVNKEDW